MDLHGKNVVYLGGFGGIGVKCVEEFLSKNPKNLFIFDMKENSDHMKEWKNKFGGNSEIFFENFDITKEETIERAFKNCFERIGPFDVVVNGCGLMDDQKLEATIDINFSGVIKSTMAALQYMDKSQGGNGGVIVNIASIAGLIPTLMFPIYGACKAGVLAFTRNLAHPVFFAKTGIKFLTICPGFTDTGLIHAPFEKLCFTFEEMKPMFDQFNKIKMQSPEDCAKNLVAAIESGDNGDVWKLDLGEKKKLEMPIYWTPAFNK